MTEHEPSFGLLNLAIYMVSITFIAQLSSLKSLFDLTECATTASQSAVNKVASTLFEDTSTEIGYAVL